MDQISEFQKLSRVGSQFLGTNFPILCGAMTWVSESNLVSAISNAGGFGVLACGSMTPDLLKAEIKKTQSLTQKPFGVNLIVMHPQIQELIDISAREKVSHIIFAGGIPSASMIETVKKVGSKVLAFAPNLLIAQKLIKNGVDALIIEGHEAGGHIGPVTTTVLAQEIIPFVKDVPIFVAGGIGRGEAMLNYMRMGAAGVQLGTRFVCALESRAHQNFKKAFISAKSRDALPTVQIDPRFPVIPVRAIANAASIRFVAFQKEMIDDVNGGRKELKEAQLAIEHFWAGALRKAVIDGDIENGSLMAGQSVGMITHEQSVQEILQELVQQATKAESLS